MIAYNSSMAGKIRNFFRISWLHMNALIMLAAGLFLVATAQSRVSAEQLGSRSLRIESPVAGAVTTHGFSFSYGGTGSAIGSVTFEYCTSPLLEIACTAPTGMDASNANLSQQSGEIGYTILDRQAGSITLSRTASIPTSNPSAYIFDNVINPTGSPDHFFVRIFTYESTDGTGPSVDFGAVTNATTEGVHLSTEVPPILKFCVGLVLGDDCTTAEDSVIDLGDMSTSRVSSGFSQMIAATNAQFGLAIAVYGTTLTSGNNVIAALSGPTVSAPGNAQFGINLRDNSDPDTGQDPVGVGLINPTTLYNTPDKYSFASGSVVATSPAATDIRKLTATYIANISGNLAPGIYTATMTYICTATF
jgi:hypothetical protein